jgi:hypothetical protein
MSQVIMIDGPGIFLEIFGFFAFCLGYAIKGLIARYIQDHALIPLLKWMKGHVDQWETTHPNRLKWTLHFLENHKGLHPNRGKCHCSVSPSLASQ